MLQFIRDRFTGVIAFLIIGAIGVTLVISFGNMGQGGVVGTFAAEVNGEEIDMRAYQRATQNLLARQQEALQGDLPEVLQEQIQRNALEALVRNRVARQYVRDSGFRIDDRSLSAVISNTAGFQVGGVFSRDSYVAVLSSQGISPDYYENEQRALMEVRQLEDAIVSSSFFTPREFRRYIELLAEEREATIVVLDPANIAAGIVIEDDDLTLYYETNPDEFRTQEAVSLDYVEIRLDEISAQISVDEQDVRDFFDTNADQYVTEEQRQGRHILIAIDDDTDENAALLRVTDLHQRLVGGEGFAALATEFSDDPVSAEQGGDLGWASRGDYVEAFATVLFELEIGGISAPVRTEFGYHIIQLDAVNSGSLRSFDEVRDGLRDELKKLRAADSYYALAEQIDDLALENPGSLDLIEAETGRKVQRIEQFTRNGGAPFGYNAYMVDTVFGVSVLDDGENSPLIEMTDESAVILRVAEHRPSVLQPFAEVRDRVEASVRFQQAGTVARERGEQILARLKAGESSDDVAAEFGIEVQRPGMLSRSSDAVGAELLAEIFRTPHPVGDSAVYRGFRLAGGGYAIFRLDSVVAGRADTIPREVRDQRKQAMARQVGANSINALVVGLREKAKVVIAPGLFDKPETF